MPVKNKFYKMCLQKFEMHHPSFAIQRFSLHAVLDTAAAISALGMLAMVFQIRSTIFSKLVGHMLQKECFILFPINKNRTQ